MWYVTTSPLWIDCDFGDAAFVMPLVSDVSVSACLVQEDTHVAVAMEPRSNVGVVLDHFQLVQLIKLLNIVTQLVDQIEADRRFFSKAFSKPDSNLPLVLYAHGDKVTFVRGITCGDHRVALTPDRGVPSGPQGTSHRTAHALPSGLAGSSSHLTA